MVGPPQMGPLHLQKRAVCHKGLQLQSLMLLYKCTTCQNIVVLLKHVRRGVLFLIAVVSWLQQSWLLFAQTSAALRCHSGSSILLGGGVFVHSFSGVGYF